jgi:fructose-specific phosphotransferase system IIC component
MGILYSLLFIVNGSIFLAVGTIFYSDVARLLLKLQEQSNWAAPQFWDLSWVFGIVRIIFIIVGIFLIAFGFGIFWFRKRLQ